MSDAWSKWRVSVCVMVLLNIESFFMLLEAAERQACQANQAWLQNNSSFKSICHLAEICVPFKEKWKKRNNELSSLASTHTWSYLASHEEKEKKKNGTIFTASLFKLWDKCRYKLLKNFLQASETLKHTPREIDIKSYFYPLLAKGARVIALLSGPNWNGAMLIHTTFKRHLGCWKVDFIRSWLSSFLRLVRHELISVCLFLMS